MAALAITITAIIAFCVGAGVTIFLFRRELSRITRFLTFHQPTADDRLTCHVADKELSDMAQAINRQLDVTRQEQLGRMNEREEFQHQLVNFSHDVRTPLMGAKGYLQLGLDEPNREARTHYLQAVETQIDDMASLLDQLHSYTQSVDPETEYDFHNHQIMPLIANELYGFYPEFEKRHWEPKVDFENEGFFVLCDEMAMKRIFDNLISNALKYGSSAISITQKGRSIWFANAVDDPDSIDAERIFERFYQADAARSEEGSGLGLAVVANLTRAMRIEVHAEVHEGEFRVRLDFPNN